MTLPVFYPFDCIRCGEEHKDGEVTFKAFTDPCPVLPHSEEGQTIQLSYWATCPINGEPILLFEVKDVENA